MTLSVSDAMRQTKVFWPAITATLILAGCTPPAGSATNPSVKTAPTTAEVVRQDLVGYTFFDGKVFTPPGVSANVYAPYNLPISEVLTTVGKRVNRGETIIKLSMPNADVAVSQAEANLQSAEAAYAAVRSQVSGPIREAEAALAQARAEERAARLDAQNGGSADVVAAEENRIAAEANLQSARAAASGIGLPERQAVEAANEYLKDARAGAKLGNVRSPIAGTVITLTAKPGVQATPKQALATVVDLRALRIHGVVPPEHKELVVKGSKVLVALDAMDSDPFEGQVTEVSVLPPSEGQKSAGYLAVIDFSNAEGSVLPDTTIKRLGIRTGKAVDVLVVPVAAVTKNAEGQSVVNVQKNGEWVATVVETGLSDGALIEIKSGLNEKDVVQVHAVTIKP